MLKFEIKGETLRVFGLKELSVENGRLFRDEVRANLTEAQRSIEIDLSQTAFFDQMGLGSLLSLHKITSGRDGKVWLVNPTPPVCQILELTRMHRIFEIVKR